MNFSIRRRTFVLATAGCVPGLQAAPLAEGGDARTYQSLRKVRGHFDGGPWRDDVDRWQGRKHLAMQNLARQMLQARAPADALRHTMGPPDAVLEPGQPAHARALEQVQWLPQAPAPNAPGTVDAANAADAPSAPSAPSAPTALHPSRPRRSLWLYRWRGRHDQLLLALERGRVVAAGWLHDGE